MTIDVTTPPPERLASAEARLGAIAPGYLARIRDVAGRLAVRDPHGDDARAALDALDELAVIDVDAPTASRVRAARLVKEAVKRLVAWYLRYFGRQLTAFGQGVSNVGAILIDRTERLEGATSDLEAKVAHLAERVDRLEQGGPGRA